METILLGDILATVQSKTAVIKIDVEAMECKVRFVNYRSLDYLVLHNLKQTTKGT